MRVRAAVLAVLVGLSVATPSVGANGKCQGGKTSTQTGRLSGLIGGLGESLITSGMNRAGLSTDYSFRSTLRAFLSDAIACSLTEAEQKQAADAQSAALNSGRIGTASRTTWKSSERAGVSGATLISSRSKVDGKACAVTTTMVTDENGQEQTVEKELCQGADGTWS
jgi:surface antigen